ncbi:hypothetical protein MTsPCn9_34340 [Croceitalea sp. MTPC9]|uniref:hypothetical protein n=1 Tax=unclassified Croceitalea TaxID=2632280 RepID=UPI002B38298C|nr:hypothetical protein MTsPCn6_34610 [Croceitalea sp. MTPC6]GMN18494.1 hypothetical protein MTsPCn9_34340 [Croceitalea sp. MTPC9]
MNKTRFFPFLLALVTTILISCSKDEEPPCKDIEPLGLLETQISDNTIYDGKSTSYLKLEEGPIGINSYVLDDLCLIRASIGMLVNSTLERQTFVKVVPNQLNTPTFSFFQVEEDAILGKWDIIENEDNWIELEEITDEIIKGRFQATILVAENQNQFYTLNDTLRFDNVYFEAPFDEFNMP